MEEPIDLHLVFEDRYNEIVPPLLDWMAARFQEHYRDWKDSARQDQIYMDFVSACVDVISQMGSKHGETYYYSPKYIGYLIDDIFLPHIEEDLKEYRAAFYKDIYRLRSIDATPFETDEECAVRIFSKLQPELDEQRRLCETSSFVWDPP